MLENYRMRNLDHLEENTSSVIEKNRKSRNSFWTVILKVLAKKV